MADNDALRRQAEALTRENAAPSPQSIEALSPEDVRRALHELHVHQIELEMQNEELRRTQAELDATRARYFDLYDLAPVGYITLSKQNLIIETNLTAATLLAVTRNVLVRRPFSRFILPEDQTLYYRFHKQLFKTDEPTSPAKSCELRLMKKDGPAFWAHLEATVAQNLDGTPVLRVALSDITDRKQLEEINVEYATRLEVAMQAANMAWWEMDISTGQVIFNKRKTDLLGYSPENFHYYQDFTALVHLDDYDNVMNAMKGYLAGLFDKYETEYRILTKSGEYKWFYDIGSIIKKDSNGVPLTVAGIVLDITDRKQAEKQLRQSETLLRTLIDTLPERIFVKDLDGRFTLANAAEIRLDGATSFEELRGKSDFDFYPIELAQQYHQAERAVLSDGQALIDYEEPSVDQTGQTRWHSSTKVPLRDADGHIMGLVGVARDITERKQAAAALQASERRYKALIENQGEGLGYVDLAEVFTFCNPAAENLFGVPAGQLVGHSLREFVAPEQFIEIQRQTALRQQSQKSVYEIEIRRPADDQLRQIIVTAVPQFNEQGEFLGAFGVFRDITDRKRATAALRELNATLEQRVAERTAQLTATNEELAHEIGERTRMEEALSIQYDLSLALGASDDLHQALTQILEAALRLEGLDCGGVYLTDPSGTLDLVAHHGLTPQFIEQARRYPAVTPQARMAHTGQIHYGTYQSFRAESGENVEGLRSLAVIPIMRKGQLLALLNLASHTGDAIPVNTRHALETLAQQIGSTLRRLRADVALRESEEIFNQFLEHSPIHIFVKNPQTQALRLSQNFEQMFGKPRAELLGKSVAELFPPDLAAKMVADDLRILTERQLVTVAEEFNGRFYTTIKFPIQLEGQPPYLAGYSLDITEQRQAEAALRESEEKYRALVRYSSDAIFSLDREGRYLFANEALARVYGQPLHAIIGQSLRQFFPPAEADQRLAVVRQVFATGQSQEIEGLVLTATGEARHYLTMLDPISDAGGQVVSVSCISKDITELKRTEDDLRHALVQEHELGKIKAQFIAMASHDFRTPLTTILSSADLLELYGARLSDEKKFIHLQRIQISVRNMTQLLDDVLILGRSDAGKLVCVLAPLDLVAVSRALLNDLRRTATPQHTFEFDHTDDFTGTWLDEKLLRQMLNNLLSNAIKYSPGGGPIRLSLRRDAAHVIIAVSDRGLGIPPEAQPHLYESFYRAQNVGEMPGTGLGLPIVKRAVDAHHGTIDVVSAVGAGATFTITLPWEVGSEK